MENTIPARPNSANKSIENTIKKVKYMIVPNVEIESDILNKIKAIKKAHDDKNFLNGNELSGTQIINDLLRKGLNV